MIRNAYIHIPFCKSKCRYCAFVSVPEINKITGYVYSLLKEIADNYRGEELSTLYIGGGTPSLLPFELLSKILNKFRYAEEYECTIEVNPDDVTSILAENYAASRINRISVGVQSFDDAILSAIGRRHNAASVISAVNTLNHAGFENISIDLIYGLPGQTTSGFIDDIKRALELPVKHISLYGLKIEEGTYFAEYKPELLPDSDKQADMYLAACDELEKNGYKQYEISNFALPGYSSKHNVNYWNNNTYYGFGVSAHGYTNGFRYYNTSDIDAYMNNPVQSEYAHHVTETERLEEEIFLGLRKADGINIDEINKKFNIDFRSRYGKIIDKYSPEFLLCEGERLRFTRKGFMLSTPILSEFL